MPGDFARPTGGRKPLKAVVRKKGAPPNTDVQTSGSDYGTRKATKFKATARYGTAISKAAVAGVKMDQVRKAASDAHAGKPFDPALVRHAIHLGLSEATGLDIGKHGDIQRHYKRSLLGIDSALSDYQQPLDPVHGGEKPLELSAHHAGVDAAGLTVLKETARPFHAVAGLADSGVHGFTEGLLHNKPYTFGKVLEKAGVPGAHVLGFGLDVVADPTTYVSLGTVSLARKEALKAAENAALKGAKAGMSAAGQETVARAAAKRAVAKAAPGKGLAVSFGGHAIPGVTRVTAASASGVKKAASKAPERVKNAGATAKAVVSDVRPQIRQAGVAESEHLGVRHAGRQASAEASQGAAIAERQAKAIKKQIPVDQYDLVVSAIERNKIGKLPAELREPARQLRDVYRHAKRVRARAGVVEGDVTKIARTESPAQAQTAVVAASRVERDANRKLKALERDPAASHVAVDAARGEAKVAKAAASAARKRVKFVGDRVDAARGYFPHVPAEDAKKITAVPAETIPKTGRRAVRKVKLNSSKGRSDLRPIDVQNPERLAAGETPFSTNVPLVHANYMADTAYAVAGKHLATNLHAAGREFKDGMTLHPDDAVFHYHNGDLTPVKNVPKSAAKSGQYVVLNRTTWERELRNIAPQFDRSAIGALFDKGTGVFKRVATFTPGFHARNLVGDTQMAYLSQPGHLLPRNILQAGRAVRRQTGIERAQERTLAAIPKDTRIVKVKPSPADTIKVAGKRTSLDGFLADARANGVIRSGYIARELREQGRGVGKGLRRVGGKGKAAAHRINRWMQNREDLMRLATYKHGLDRGMTPAEAADLAANTHIDYGDLTQFERNVARRVAPFYTFSARALPIHAKALVTKPGKFANIEKAREELAAGTGVSLPYAEKQLKSFQARQAPFIVKIGGKPVVISDSLPLSLLNEIPANGLTSAYLNELTQWVGQQINPWLKDPVELAFNRNLFFRSDISPASTGGLVAAPSWVSQLPPEIAKKLGVVPDYLDKRTGRKTWGWDGKADYLFKSVPGLANYAQQLMTEGVNRRGQGQSQKLLSLLTGVRVEPLDPVGTALEILFQRHDQIDKEANAYSRRGRSTANAQAVARLRREQHQIEREIYKLSRKRGDAIPLYKPSGGGGGSSLGPGLSSGLGSGL